ncbi:hypothetical protein ACFVZQ_36025, partial [Streptomyces sp. NPDC059538]
WGLPEETRALADAVVRVPIHGKAESLNLARGRPPGTPHPHAHPRFPLLVHPTRSGPVPPCRRQGTGRVTGRVA